MWRETWGKTRGVFHLDHRTAVSLEPEREVDYDNLVYACASCNLAKRAIVVPDPLVVLVSEAVQVEIDGTLTTRTPEAQRIVEQLDLSSDEEIETRARLIDLLELLAELRPAECRRWLGYPEDLPNLSALKPPGGNTRPDGVQQSHFDRKNRGELPETY